MARDSLFGPTIDLVTKNLDLRMKNQMYIAANIANTETPNYASKTFSFENQLKDALHRKDGRAEGSATPHPRHIPLKRGVNSMDSVEGYIEEASPATAGKDGNSVDLEREMGRMAENQILYNASVQILSKKMADLTYAIRGGN